MKRRKSLTPKFDKFYESCVSRYTAAYFAVNDVIEVDISKLKKIEAFKKLTKQMQDATLDLCQRAEDGDVVIGVAHVQLHYGMVDDASPSTITIGADIGGGRYIDQITLPGECGEAFTVLTDPFNRISTIPKNSRIDYRNGRREGTDKWGRYEMDMKKLEKDRTKGYAATVDGTQPYDPLKNPTHYGNYFHNGL